MTSLARALRQDAENWDTDRRWWTVALCLGLACEADVSDDELESPPDVQRPSVVYPDVKVPFVPAGNVWTAKHGVPLPLMHEINGLAMMDRFDVGNVGAEELHRYSASGPAPRIERDFVIPVANVSYREDGRALRATESFVVQVAPQQDNYLVKAFDAVQGHQEVRVLVEGVPVGNWTTPSGDGDRYGEAVFPLRAVLVGERSRLRLDMEYVSGEPDVNAFVYWVFAKPARKLTAPVRTSVEGLWLTDGLDVGNPPDEGEHDYFIEDPTFGGNQQFEWPDGGGAFIEDGRATGSYESFDLAVIPGRDHLLVKAFDTYSKGQVVRVLVAGKLVGDWALLDGPARYAEDGFRIPAEFIGTRRQVTVRIEFVSASLEFNSFYYWMFADPRATNG